MDYCIERWQTLHPALGGWRSKTERFEKLATDNYDDRKTANPDPAITDATRSIFAKQNNTLGILSGTVDFVFAQARDDIFGTRPWLGATPQGMSDSELAEKITKHSQWKFDQSNLEETLIDAIKLAVDLGTSFVKPNWIKDIETFEENKDVAHWKGEPLLDDAGEYITTEERLWELHPHLKPPAPGEDPVLLEPEVDPTAVIDPLAPPVAPQELIDGADIKWVEMNIEQTQEVYNNVSAACIDYKEIAFDTTAPEMDLKYTDVFHRFRMGLLDAISYFDLGEEEGQSLRNCVAMGPNTEVRYFRDEQETERPYSEGDANPQISLVEGFVRCDPFQKSSPKRIRVVFIPELSVILSCDYLANVTPGGILPIFPIRCFKTPRRILGRGYWERYEDGDTAIDTLFNSTTYCDRINRFPIKAFDRTQFDGEIQAKDLNSDPDKVWALTPEGSLEKAIQFLPIPDTGSRSDALLQQLVQTHQNRTGVTSAAQGEMKGLPQSNTATGVNQIMSRGAQLLSWPIESIRKDLQKSVEYSVHLNFANLNAEEIFTVGEGQDAVLMTIAPGDIQGLRANVSLSLTRSQNMDKLQDAQVALQTLGQYVALPEIEKEAARKLVVQILRSLGFVDADTLVRSPIADPAGLLAIAPPELQGQLQAAMEAAGMIVPEQPQEGSGGPPQANPSPVG